MARLMKDSGVEWIGAIPEEWAMVKLKVLLEEVKKKNIENKRLALKFTYGNIVNKVVHEKDELYLYTCVEPNDVIVNGLNLEFDFISQRVGLVKTSGVITSAYICMRPTNLCNAPYICYLLKAADGYKVLHSMGRGLRQILSYKELSSYSFVLPPIMEQIKVAAYLDIKCAEIDKVVEQTRATIEEYKKLKQAIITEAVTKGVRGARPMKPSGVEWIGDMPAEWDLLKTLWLLEMPITDGPHETPTLYDDGIPFISAEAVSCGRGGIDFSHKRGYISREYYDECCKKYTPRLHDIYMIKSGATTGRVSMVDTEELFTIWSPLAVLRANQEKMLPRFLFYSLQADYYQKQISLSWSFGTQQNIGMRVLEQLKIATPDTNEQQEIAAYLDTKCAEIDRIIEKKEQLIEEFGSYKKSLIYECVTGKREIKTNNYSQNAIH